MVTLDWINDGSGEWCTIDVAIDGVRDFAIAPLQPSPSAKMYYQVAAIGIAHVAGGQGFVHLEGVLALGRAWDESPSRPLKGPVRALHVTVLLSSSKLLI